MQRYGRRRPFDRRPLHVDQHVEGAAPKTYDQEGNADPTETEGGHDRPSPPQQGGSVNNDGPDRSGWLRLQPLGPTGPFVNFQQVKEPKVGKVREGLGQVPT